MTPNLTLNYGLRWDLQTPFKAANNSLTTVSLQSVCGMSGLRRRQHVRQVRLLQPGRQHRRGAAVRAARQGQQRLRDRLEQHRARASARRGSRMCRAASCGRSSAIPIRRRCAAATPSRSSVRASAPSRASTAAIRAATLSTNRTSAQRQPGACRASRGRFSSASPNGCIQGRSRDADVSRDGPQRPAGQPQRLRARHRHRLGAHVVAELPARDQPRHGGRLPLRRHASGVEPVVGAQLQHARHPVQRLHRRVQARDGQPPGEQRRRRREPRGQLRLLRRRHRHQPAADLPRVHQRAAATRTTRPPTPATPGRRPASRRTWRSATRRRATRRPTSTATTTRRTNAIAAGLPANFFVVNPAVDENNVTDSGAFSDYHALQIDLRRRLSKGLSAGVNYQYALEGGSAFLGFAYGRVMNPSDQRASRDQDAVGLDDTGRPRSPLRHRHASGRSTAFSAAGRSTASAASSPRWSTSAASTWSA